MLLAAKLIIRIHFLLVFVFEVKEALKLLVVEGHFDNVYRDMLWTVIFWTFDDVVAAPQVLAQVPLHAVDAEGMTALLLAVVTAQNIADVA